MIVAFALVLGCLFAFISCGDDCTHRDADDNGKCDKCDAEFTDGNEPETPDDPDTPDTPDDPDGPDAPADCEHRDANDDGKCDKCQADFTDGAETQAPVYIVKDGATAYKVIYAANDEVSRPGATELRATIVLSYIDGDMAYSDDSAAEVALEILFGRTNRQLSVDLTAAIDARDTGKNLLWGYAERDGKIAFYANNAEAFKRGWAEFKALIFVDDEIRINAGLWSIGEVTEAQLEQEKADAEAEAERIHQEKIDALRDKIESTKYNFGKIPDFPQEYPVPSIVPTAGDHPRLWVTEDDLAQIIENLGAYENLTNYNKVLKNADLTYDGKLPSPSTLSTTYNYSADGLAKIESLAFMYLTTGDKLYGYTAIYATKNYLKTLVITNDLAEKRYFAGACMYIFSEVYDWCYDLLSTDDKNYIVRGVCNALGTHFEIGVPPAGQGSVSGHGTGAQLLRNWISFSIAVYDEYPQIYNNVVGRFFAQYLDAPNWYYQSGVNFQGSAYGPGKTELNVISELLMYNMSGQYMYDVSFRPVAYSFIHYLRPDGQAIRVGDDYSQRNRLYGKGSYASLAFFCASLYDDPHLKAWASSLSGKFEAFGWSGEMALTPVTFLILNKPWITYTEEDAFNIPLINYNGSPTGAITAHSAWNDESAWMTYTKIGEALANNHEHKDAGTFQIYYKGILAMTSSCYEYSGYKDALYGSKLDLGYNKQTISKNGLLIYNPNMGSNGNWLYSGGQSIKPNVSGEFASLAQWQASQASRQAKTLAHSYKYDAEGNVVYAYISGDITNAYDSETVDLVTRATISIQTNDPEHPLLFLVYDRIISDSASYKKTFLLHTPSEPTVNGNVITFTNTELQNNGVQNNGKLVSTTLLPANATITAIGGDGREFEVNGTNLYPANKNDASVQEIGWGRLEVSPSTESKDDTFLHVMYVGDADETAAYIPATLISSETHDGAVSMDKIVFFSKTPTETLCEKVNVTTTGEGSYDYYFNGMRTGVWEVKLNGTKLGNYVVDSESDLLTFTAGAGEIEITPVFANLSFELNGGEALVDFPTYYQYDVELALPIAKDLYKKGYDFAGWYKSADFSGEAITTIATSERDDVKLYAKWERNSGFISYDLGGGVAANDFVELFKFGTSVTLPTANDISKLGCAFEGWYTNPEFTGEPITEISAEIRDDVTLYAKWRHTSSVIIYNTNGGTIKQDYTALTDGTKDIDLPLLVERNSATFGGWYLDTSYTTPVSKITADMLLDNGEFTEVNVYAKWIVKVFDNDFSKDPEGINIQGKKEIVDGKLIWTQNMTDNNRPVMTNGTANTFAGAFRTGVEPYATVRLDAYLAENQGQFRIRILDEDGKNEFNFIYISDRGLTIGGYGGEVLSPLYKDRAVKVEILIDFVNKSATYYIDGVRTTVVEGLTLSDPDKYTNSGRCFNGRLDSGLDTVILLDYLSLYAGNNLSISSAFSEVKYELNGGSATAILPNSYTEGVEFKLPTTVEKAGFKFLGWYDNPDFNGEPITKIGADATGTVTVYAKWEEVAGKLSFVLNDGEVSVELPELYTYGETLVLPTKDDISKLGGTFAGWYDNPEFTGEPITELTVTDRGAKTLYAKWILGIGVVDYHLFGGTVNGEYVKESDGTADVTLPTNVTRAGATFLGWYLDEAYTQPVSVLDASLFRNGDSFNTVKVYARWSQVFVENDFSSNAAGFGGAGINVENGMLHWIGTAKGPVLGNSTANSFTALFNNGAKPIVLFSFELMAATEEQAELRFRFYNSEATIETVIMTVNQHEVIAGSASKSIATLNSDTPVKIDIVADFVAKTLTYYVDGAYAYTIENATFSTPDDYVHSGRCLNIRMQNDQNDDTANESIFFDRISIVVGVDPYADVKFLSIEYDLGGGSATTNLPVSYQEGVKATIPTDVVRNGYAFAGWYTNPDFTGEAVTEIPETSTGDVKLYAKWTKLYNAITYVLNGGTTTENCPDRHTTGTATNIPQNVTKSGATFLGWYDNPNFSGDPVTEIPAEYDGDVTLYARFSAIILNADFDGSFYNEKEGAANINASMVGTGNNQAEWIAPSDDNANDGYLSVYNDGQNGSMNQFVSITNMSLAGYYTVTFEFDIWADLVNGTVAAPRFCLRTYTAGGSPFIVFDCFANGNIQVAGKSLGTLTTERSHVKIELTIAPDGTATAVGQLGDGEAVTSTFSCPNKGVSELTNAQFYFGEKTVVDVDGEKVAPKVYLDNIKVSAQ